MILNDMTKKKNYDIYVFVSVVFETLFYIKFSTPTFRYLPLSLRHFGPYHSIKPQRPTAAAGQSILVQPFSQIGRKDVLVVHRGTVKKHLNLENKMSTVRVDSLK